MNLLLVRQGIFPGSVMLDAVHFDTLSKGTRDRAAIEAGAAYARKINPDFPQHKEIPPKRLVSDEAYESFFKELVDAEAIAQTNKVGIWSDKFKALRGE